MLSDLILKYNLEDFVETGYGSGDGVRDALEAGFESVTSIEIIPAIAGEAGHEWAEDDDRVTILENNSYDGLSLVCQKLRGPICFSLDAYLPGTFGYTGQADEFNFPLEMELEIIKACRPDDMKDVILVGGLSLYERGCERPLGGWKHSPYQNSNFIERIFGDTHQIERDLSGAGFATLTPKDMDAITKPIEPEKPKTSADPFAPKPLSGAEEVKVSIAEAAEEIGKEPWRDDAGLEEK